MASCDFVVTLLVVSIVITYNAYIINKIKDTKCSSYELKYIDQKMYTLKGFLVLGVLLSLYSLKKIYM